MISQPRRTCREPLVCVCLSKDDHFRWQLFIEIIPFVLRIEVYLVVLSETVAINNIGRDVISVHVYRLNVANS